MNIVDYVIIGIVAISMIYGIYKGFVKTLLSSACFLLAIFLSFTFAPKLSAILSGNETIASSLANYTDAIARVGDYDLAQTAVNALNESGIDRIIQAVNLPDRLAEILRENLAGSVFENLGLSTVNEYVSNTIVTIVLNILCYLVCFFVFRLVLKLLAALIEHIFRLPVLKQMDWLAGGVFGILRGAALVYLLFLLVPLFDTVVNMEAPNPLTQSVLAPYFQSGALFTQIASYIGGK